jgi:saccharopine dehydrogenase-like NADP-dependent oxidoreductase
MAKKALLVGLGMQGKAALHDLVDSGDVSQVVVVDNQPGLETYVSRYPSGKVSLHCLDAADEAGMSRLMRGIDVVVEALPGPFALPLGRLAAECGVSLVSSMYYLNPGEQDAGKILSARKEIQRVDQQAKEKGAVILTEFGLDPGLDLIMGARAIGEMDEVREFYTYGAGIPGPNARSNPLKYKFSWSIIGVIRSYRRPARVISGGEVVNIEAARMFEAGNCHTLDLPEIGVPLECFPNGDSVHYAELLGIMDTVEVMGRYTCRLPGHCAFWDTMVKSGFLDEVPVRQGDVSASPAQFTAAILASQEQFHYTGDEQDMTFIRVDARGTRRGKDTRVIYQLIDTRDLKTGFTSMQRTVGFTLSLGARLILGKKLQKSGLLTALDVPYESVFPALEKHNIRVSRQEIPPLS